MALAPKFAGYRFPPAVSTQSVHTIELYLDYVCPFSAKMFKTLYTQVLPKIEKSTFSNKVQFVFRPQIQPWHPSSTLVHEAGVAVQRLDPAKFWPFSAALFNDQKSYYDVSVVNETRNNTYKRLAKLAASVGVDEDKFLDLVLVPEHADAEGGLNLGNKVTNDLKVHLKIARSVGVHVSPTVYVDGVVENSISSSFSGEQWEEFLSKTVQ